MCWILGLPTCHQRDLQGESISGWSTELLHPTTLPSFIQSIDTEGHPKVFCYQIRGLSSIFIVFKSIFSPCFEKLSSLSMSEITKSFCYVTAKQVCPFEWPISIYSIRSPSSTMSSVNLRRRTLPFLTLYDTTPNTWLLLMVISWFVAYYERVMRMTSETWLWTPEIEASSLTPCATTGIHFLEQRFP